MEESKRILKVLAVLLIGSLLAWAQSSELVLLEADSDFASYGNYNESINTLLYFGVSVDDTGEIVGSSISLRNLDTGKETVLEKNTAFPAVGWINDSTVLIDKIIPSQG